MRAILPGSDVSYRADGHTVTFVQRSKRYRATIDNSGAAPIPADVPVTLGLATSDARREPITTFGPDGDTAAAIEVSHVVRTDTSIVIEYHINLLSSEFRRPAALLRRADRVRDTSQPFVLVASIPSAHEAVVSSSSEARKDPVFAVSGPIEVLAKISTGRKRVERVVNGPAERRKRSLDGDDTPSDSDDEPGARPLVKRLAALEDLAQRHATRADELERQVADLTALLGTTSKQLDAASKQIHHVVATLGTNGAPLCDDSLYHSAATIAPLPPMLNVPSYIT